MHTLPQILQHFLTVRSFFLTILILYVFALFLRLILRFVKRQPLSPKTRMFIYKYARYLLFIRVVFAVIAIYASIYFFLFINWLADLVD